MHSYQHNIKTFNNATRHLTRVERSLYRDLIELYYDTEHPLQAVDFSRLCRQVIANSDEEKDALKYVLSEFFVKTGDVYTHNYCDEVIDKFQTGIDAKSKAGVASAQSKKNRAMERINERSNKKQHENENEATEINTCSTVVTNQEPETINQEPVLNTSGKKASPAKASAEPLPIPDFVKLENWNDFIEVRKGLKAKNTIQAMKALITQLNKIVSAGDDADEVVLQSIRSSWKDLYPIKKTFNGINQREQGVTVAASSIFKDEYIAEQTTTTQTIEVEHEQKTIAA